MTLVDNMQLQRESGKTSSLGYSVSKCIQIAHEVVGEGNNSRCRKFLLVCRAERRSEGC